MKIEHKQKKRSAKYKIKNIIYTKFRGVVLDFQHLNIRNTQRKPYHKTLEHSKPKVPLQSSKEK